MTPKQRVLAAINHQKPDKMPTDLGTTNCTSIVKHTYEKLKAHLGIECESKMMFSPFQIMLCDESVLKALKVDTRHLCANYDAYEQKEWVSDDMYKDRFGVLYKMPDNGLYFDFYDYPLKDFETVEEIEENYTWPAAVVPAEFEGLRERAKKLHEEGEYALVGDVVNSGIWERSQNMRGFEQFLVDIMVEKEIAHYVLRKMTDHQKERMEKYLEAVGEYLDVVFVGDDLATGQSTIMSLDTFREMVKPYLKEYYAFLKERAPKAKLMYHSCGAIVPFIDDLIEIGVDILNPIQVNASGMDTKQLKARFGEKLVFWGAIDAHTVMPTGTVDDVKKEVEHRISDLGPEGYVVCENHNIQADIPVENVVALFTHAKEVEI